MKKQKRTKRYFVRQNICEGCYRKYYCQFQIAFSAEHCLLFRPKEK